MVLGAYDLRCRERSRQTFSIRSVSENGYDPQQNLNDVLLLQVGKGVGSWRQPEGLRGSKPCAGSLGFKLYSQVHNPLSQPLDPGH